MKSANTVVFSTLTLLALAVSPAMATIYADSTGETISSANIDIASVEITNNATDIFFNINLNGSIVTPNDWGNYMVGIDSVVGGDTAGNAWVRPISMSSGMDYWLGSWVNGGGGSQLWSFSGSWAQQNTVGVTIGSQSFSFSQSLASMGLSAGNSFTFDVYSSGTGSGDGAIDAVANPNQTIANWPDNYNSGANVFTYTVTPVPEPASLTILALGSLLAWRRVMRPRA
jgi:hypothetical protein